MHVWVCASSPSHILSSSGAAALARHIQALIQGASRSSPSSHQQQMDRCKGDNIPGSRCLYNAENLIKNPTSFCPELGVN